MRFIRFIGDWFLEDIKGIRSIYKTIRHQMTPEVGISYLAL